MFTIRNYSSDEYFDIGKFMPFEVDVYDVLNCPFLTELKALSVENYYDVNKEGFRDIDIIASKYYGDCFYAFMIQYYNDISEEKVPEGTILKMFSKDDLNDLYYNLSIRENK